MTNYDCVICGKPTRSHKLSEDPDVYVCHVCFITKPDEMAKIDVEVEKIRREKAAKAAEAVIALLKLAKGVE